MHPLSKAGSAYSACNPDSLRKLFHQFSQQVENVISKRLQTLLLALPLLVASSLVVSAEYQPGWLSTRNQNPFALISGLPVAPAAPAAGSWQVDASISIANTELAQLRGDSQLLLDTETHESRLSIAHAWNERWSARASFTHLRASAGFLDGPVERFHDAFGFDNGDRGQLDTIAPRIELRRGSQTLALLSHSRSLGVPLMLDLTRQWQPQTYGSTGITLGLAIPVGGSTLVDDDDDPELSLSAHTLKELGDHLTVGVRLGVLARDKPDLLGAEAKSLIPFGNLLLRYRLGAKWSALMQADAHDALYRDLPGLAGFAGNQLSFGFARQLAKRGEFVATLGEDVPALHSADVALHLGLRMGLGH